MLLSLHLTQNYVINGREKTMQLIDADELCEYWLYNGLNERIYDTNDVLESIDEQPDVDPESLRPTAHWINRGYVCGENAYECSACHQTEWRTSASRMKYCMFCGARMVNTDEKHCT